MELLAELLALNEDRDLETLLEDLGKLKMLGLGRMANAFKQSYRYYDDGRGRYSNSGPRASDVGNKIKARNTWIGPNSEIIDSKGTIKNWGTIKKAYRDADAAGTPPAAAVIYVQNKACALIIGDIDKMSSQKQVFGLSYDFTGLLDEDETLSIVSVLPGLVPDGGRSVDSTQTNPKGSSKALTHRFYGDKGYENAVKHYEGFGVLHKNMGAFIDGLVETFGAKLKFKIITQDKSMQDTVKQRSQNRPVAPSDIKLFKDDITVRLAKYKLNNAVTVNNVREFLDKIFNGDGKKIKFAGETYEAKPSDANGKVSVLMHGKTAEMTFSVVRRPGEYSWDVTEREIYVGIKLEGMTIKPVYVKYREYGEPPEGRTRGRPTGDWKKEMLE